MVSFLLEFWQFARAHKKYWLMPILFCLLGVGTLLFFAQGSAVAPFIYTLF